MYHGFVKVHQNNTKLCSNQTYYYIYLFYSSSISAHEYSLLCYCQIVMYQYRSSSGIWRLFYKRQTILHINRDQSTDNTTHVLHIIYIYTILVHLHNRHWATWQLPGMGIGRAGQGEASALTWSEIKIIFLDLIWSDLTQIALGH